MSDRSPLDLDSLAPFEGQSRADWRYLVEKGLRGTEFESLTQLTEDGLTRGPLMTLSERPIAPAAIMRGREPLLDGRDWHICAPVRDMDLAFANEQLLRDLINERWIFFLLMGLLAIEWFLRKRNGAY